MALKFPKRQNLRIKKNIRIKEEEKINANLQKQNQKLKKAFVKKITLKKEKEKAKVEKNQNPHNEKSAWKDLRKDYPLTKTPNQLVVELKKNSSKGNNGAFFRGSVLIPFYVKTNNPNEDIIVVSSEHGTRGDGYFYINKKNMNQAVFD